MVSFRLQIPLFLLAFMLCHAVPAQALTETDAPERTIADYIKDYVDVPEGAVDWKIFSKTKELKIEGRDADGMDYSFVKPEFPEDVKALNGKKIKIKGYMFPLESEDNQKMFLFGPFPVSCPFHYHVGPSMVLEVYTKGKGIKFSYDPLVLTGTLELVPEDLETGVFYRLKNASVE
ncbi:MAG: hypothetical protein DI626_05700 [Micavibrio aeruginosavorus]|uniref:DUF3299 domain-containing protein n=1 Tax=Micavibrio aeruginosavorus TaxID=349221 RepID=A0A2W4ZWK1_9BACT|nr:MAG: hypothetical protein DI626_05700 [Micavibrio aeruginosavorus]